MGRFRALAITTLLLGGTAMLPSAAQAALFISTANDSIVQLNANGGGATSTVEITSLPGPWVANGTAGPGAKWISWADTGAGSNDTTPDDSVTPWMTVAESFTASAGQSLTGGTVYADDTVRVLLKNVTDDILVTTLVNPAIGQDGACAAGAPGCQAGEGAAFAFAGLEAGKSYQVLFEVFQRAGNGFGVQYAFSVVPIPGAALLFGSALAGLAWVRRRGQKADAPLAA